MGTGSLTVNEEARSSVLDKPMFKLLPTKCGTADNKKLQLAGPVSVIAALACAECGAHALAYWPSSSLLWYVDLEVFRPLQYSFGAANERLAFGDLAQTICVVAPLLALICIGLITGRRLPFALASNMSVLYGAALLYGSYVAETPAAGTGGKLAALWGPSFFLAVSILLAAFVSSALSHWTYWREIFFKVYVADEVPFQTQYFPCSITSSARVTIAKRANLFLSLTPRRGGAGPV